MINHYEMLLKGHFTCFWLPASRDVIIFVLLKELQQTITIYNNCFVDSLRKLDSFILNVFLGSDILNLLDPLKQSINQA